MSILMIETGRPMGIESEYGLLYAFSEAQQQEQRQAGEPVLQWGADPGKAISTVIARYLPSDVPVARGMIGNGMRMIREVGEHPELSGAEALSIQDVIDGDLAADKMTWLAFRRAYQAGAIQNFRLLRRTIDGQGTSWGRHENYQVRRSAVTTENNMVSPKKLQPIIPFLAVRQQMGGAGCLHEGTFWMGQKTITAVDDINGETTFSKPLMNTRDEPHGDEYRGHVVSVDFNSPHITARNLATTSLVWALIEHRMAPELRITRGVSNWAYFAKRIGRDLSLSDTVEINGKTMTGLNVHEAYLERAYQMSDDMLSSDERWGREAWTNILGRLKAVQSVGKQATSEVEKGELLTQAIAEHLGGETDWADRFMHIQHVRGHDGVGELWPVQQHMYGFRFQDFSPRSSQVDIAYDIVGTGRGQGPNYRQRLETPQAALWVDAERVDRRMRHAPGVGRAALREKFLYTFAGDPNAQVDWGMVSYAFPGQFSSLETKTLRLPDVAASTSELFDAFVARAQQAQPESLRLYNRAMQSYEQRKATDSA